MATVKGRVHSSFIKLYGASLILFLEDTYRSWQMEVANSPSRKRSRREYEASNEKSTRDSPRRISPRATRQAGSTRDAAIIIPSPSPTEKSLTLDAQNKPEIVTIPSDDPLETPDLSAPLEGESTHNDSLVDQEFVGEFNCPVCFELICMAVTTACGHSFCRPCLEEWLDGKVAVSPFYCIESV